MGPEKQPLADAFCDRLLRHRVDGDQCKPTRPFPLRFGGHAIYSPTMRSNDRGRTSRHEDAPGSATHLASDARTEVVHFDGCLRMHRRSFRYLCGVQGIDRFIPVDLYIPGCPPRPEQLIRAVIDLQEKIQKTGTIYGREFASRVTPEGPERFDEDEVVRIRDRQPMKLNLPIYNPRH